MKKVKMLNILILMLILMLALVRYTTAEHSSEEVQTFYQHEYPGLEITINATSEARPGENIRVVIWVRCTAENVQIDHLVLYVFGLENGQNETLLQEISHVVDSSPKCNQTIEGNYTIQISSDVWGKTYGELSLKYSVVEFPFSIERDRFLITYIKDIDRELLEKQLESLSENYTQLNESFRILQQNYTYLNQTYWYLKLNKTSGTEVQLGNTRVAMIIFIITTVFFAATTLYLTIKKPKKYW